METESQQDSKNSKDGSKLKKKSQGKSKTKEEKFMQQVLSFKEQASSDKIITEQTIQEELEPYYQLKHEQSCDKPTLISFYSE